MKTSQNKIKKLIVLYNLAEELYELKPWEILSDSDLVQIFHPKLEPTLISIMGREKIHEGFSIAYGTDNTTAFLGLFTALKSEPDISKMRYQRTFSIHYEKYSNLSKEEQEEIKECYEKISYKAKYPIFSRYDYGKYPRTLLVKEIDLLIKILNQLLETLSDALVLPTKPDYTNDKFLFRFFSHNKKSFQTYIGPLATDIFVSIPKFNITVPKDLKTNNMSVEIDSLYLPFRVGKNKGMTLFHLLADTKTGMVFEHFIEENTTNREERFANFYLRMVEKYGYFKHVACRNMLDVGVLVENLPKNTHSLIEIKPFRILDDAIINLDRELLKNSEESINSSYIN